MQYVKIPSERIKVLIGRGGKERKEIEKRTKTRIKVENGEVSIEGEPMGEWITKDIIKAIGRGFSPEKALRLLNEDNTLEIISLKEFFHTEKTLKRKKGRIIGEKGRSKRVIENLTDTYISVYGKTIGVLGSYDGVEIAKEAIFKLLDGAPHSTVYRFLEKNVYKLKGNLQAMQ